MWPEKDHCRGTLAGMGWAIVAYGTAVVIAVIISVGVYVIGRYLL